MTDQRLTPWEVEAVTMLDDAYLVFKADEAQAEQQRRSAERS